VVGPQKDDRIVVENTRDNERSEMIGTLSISNILRTDDGLYECIASNEASCCFIIYILYLLYAYKIKGDAIHTVQGHLNFKHPLCLRGTAVVSLADPLCDKLCNLTQC
jgi:hypothetical protein